MCWHVTNENQIQGKEDGEPLLTDQLSDHILFENDLFTMCNV